MMKTAKIYIEVPVSERLPEVGRIVAVVIHSGDIRTGVIIQNTEDWYVFGISEVYPKKMNFITHWLEPVQVPSHEEIEAGKGFMKNEMFALGYNRAVNWILEKLKIK